MERNYISEDPASAAKGLRRIGKSRGKYTVRGTLHCASEIRITIKKRIEMKEEKGRRQKENDD